MGGLAAGHRLRPLRCGADQYRGDREAQREVRFCDLPGGLPAFSVKSTSDIVGKRTRRSRGAQSDRRVRHQSGADPAGLERGQPRRRTAAGPAGLPDDDASGNLYIQSGRADIFSARSRWQPIKRRLTARPGWWARAESVGGDNHQKGNGLVYALQAASTGRLPAVNISRCWRVGEQGEAVAQSVVNPPGITY